MAELKNRLLLASLGAGPYYPAYYTLNGTRSEKTELSFHALAEHLEIPFENLRIFGTDPEPENNLSRGSKWDLMISTFGRELQKHQRITVPFGLKTDDHYRFFRELIAVVEDADELVVDMTHGFRSFPVVLLMSLFFSEAVHEKPFDTLRIFYGAYEAGQDTEDTFNNARGEEKSVKEVPLVEMNIVPELLQWTKAAERLIKYGLAGDMADLVKDFSQNWDKRFKDLDRALAYNAVHLIPEEARKVRKRFEQNKRKINEQTPIYYLQDSVTGLVNRISGEKVSDQQLEVAQYFFRIGRYGQSSIVLLEYAISRISERYVELKGSGASIAKQEVRNLPSKVLTLLTQKNSRDKKSEKNAEKIYHVMEKWSAKKTKKLADKFSDLNDIRNIVAHGKQVTKEQLKDYHCKVSDILNEAEDLFDFSDAPVDEWVELIS